jgi:hypothetical protein
MRRVLGLTVSAVLYAFAACAPSPDESGQGPSSGTAADGAGAASGQGQGADGSGPGGATGAGASSSGATSGGGSSGLGAGASAGSGGAFAWVDFSYKPPPTQNESCAETTLEAGPVEVQVEVQVPVEVEVEIEVDVPGSFYLMLDRSYSMICWDRYNCGTCNPGGDQDLWGYAKNAITAFVNDPVSEGRSAALEYFPLSNHSCNGDGYDVPAVAMGELPGNADAIVASLDATSPSGCSTPTEGALNGIRKFCQQYNVSHPGVPCVGVLITDGEPQSCSTNTTTLRNIASGIAADGNLLYVVGMPGANFTFLNNLAISAGTDCTPGTAGGEACDASDEATFLAALQAIAGQITETTTVTEYHTEYVTETQTQSIPCEYTIPSPDTGIVDPSQIELIFSSGSNSQYIPPAGDVSSCGDGWYFDDPASPTKVLFCPSTCQVLEGLPDGRVDIEFGCLGS